MKTPLYSQQVDNDVGAELCNDNGSEASPLALIWGTGLLGVVTSLAKRKSDEFDSHVLHHTLLYANWQSGLIQNQLFVSSTLTRSTRLPWKADSLITTGGDRLVNRLW